jgi:hypothetical protein
MFESTHVVVYQGGNKNKIRIIAEKSSIESFKIDFMYPNHTIQYVGRDSENRNLNILVPTPGKTVVILNKKYTPVKGAVGKFIDSENGICVYVLDDENIIGTDDGGPYFTINTQTGEMTEVPDYELMIRKLIWCD